MAYRYGRTDNPTRRPEPDKVCEFCERPALYRYGVRGRCKAHKDIPTLAEIERRYALERLSDIANAALDAEDRLLRVVEDRENSKGQIRELWSLRPRPRNRRYI